MLSDVDARGNKDLFISQRNDLWQVKTKPLNPVSGIARSCHARNLDDEIQDELRTKGLEGDKYLFSMMVPQKESAIIASGVESFARNESGKLKGMLNEKNKNMEKDLMDEVEKTFEKKFLQRKNLFM
ncbi:MAG: hypothetical protein ACFFCS_11060 [Candidatus Hodarchaeota archaeon]